MLAPAVLVLDDERCVALLAAELVANRRRARPRHDDVTVVRLDRDPRRAFEQPAPSPDALRAAREVLVLATGADRAGAMHAMLEGPEGRDAPASMLRDHPSVLVLCDPAAAAGLTAGEAPRSDHVVVVLGHREPGVSSEHRISSHSRARLFRAEELCLETPIRAAVLTGYTQTGGLSEAEQLGREWTLRAVPPVLEVGGRITAENASLSLPLIMAMGGIRHVTVVTSPWHIRAPYFFAPYRRFGLRVHLAPARPLRHWRHLLAHELRALPAAPAQRRAAMGHLQLLASAAP